jgi:hypothetical protein
MENFRWKKSHKDKNANVISDIEKANTMQYLSHSYGDGLIQDLFIEVTYKELY